MRLIVIDRHRSSKMLYRLLLIFMIVICVYVGSKEAISVFSLPIKNMVVIIDAGHGGRDPGASGSLGTVEEQINLEIALKLRRLIEQAGGLALMIREDDYGLYTEGRDHNRKREDLLNRHKLINESGANILVSIHLNYFPQPQYYGAQTFYNRNDIKGKKLAELVQKELIKTLNRGNDRVAKPIDTVFLLRDNVMPGVLIECGFLSNYEEELLLREDHYQEKIAWSIFCGIVKYFESEKK
ncbi:MAG: N-acetylmuramoyl-L-alanine amidase CwlD [Bacillota bacterium]